MQAVDASTAAESLQKHRAKGMPEALVQVLLLAGKADARILIFDADPAILDGLTRYHD